MKAKLANSPAMSLARKGGRQYDTEKLNNAASNLLKTVGRHINGREYALEQLAHYHAIVTLAAQIVGADLLLKKRAAEDERRKAKLELEHKKRWDSLTKAEQEAITKAERAQKAAKLKQSRKIAEQLEAERREATRLRVAAHRAKKKATS
jgi:hypothetical protein